MPGQCEGQLRIQRFHLHRVRAIPDWLGRAQVAASLAVVESVAALAEMLRPPKPGPERM